jgi:protein-L-isoaspartate(D-aspartate) O-methyltransferase
MIDGRQCDGFWRGREKMVQSQLRERGIRDSRVLEAMAQVPRHLFVPASHQLEAYEDHPILIDCGQTISQPYIVAYMLELLAVQPEDVVLEVGTGSGYQTALLSQLAARVYSVERHAELADHAAARLKELRSTNVEIVIGDGTRGLPQRSPFDAIMVSAAAPELPQQLVNQLGAGGRMVIPVGPPEAQYLHLVRKGSDGTIALSKLDACRFVPLIGEHGYAAEI